jgi:hypothetical protein
MLTKKTMQGGETMLTKKTMQGGKLFFYSNNSYEN